MLRIVTKCEEMLQNVKNCYNSTNVLLLVQMYYWE